MIDHPSIEAGRDLENRKAARRIGPVVGIRGTQMPTMPIAANRRPSPRRTDLRTRFCTSPVGMSVDVRHGG